MRYGLSLPPFDELADPFVMADLARRAEAAGWDGLFLWDHVQYRHPVQAVADPWIVMAAVALATERIRIGPMVTPLARRRPQIVARQCTTLDHLSGGRLTLGAGLGLDRSGRELSAFAEETDDRTRAAMLDEALEVITALWSGEAVDHGGPHYTAADVRFLPRPIQRPRIPVWAAGRHPNQAPIRRAARWDGMNLIDVDHPDQVAEVAAGIAAHRPSGDLDGFDLAVGGAPGIDPRGYDAAGATWWLVGPEPWDLTASTAGEIVDAGPRELAR